MQNKTLCDAGWSSGDYRYCDLGQRVRSGEVLGRVHTAGQAEVVGVVGVQVP